jgi:hypothetical protein
MGVKMPKKVPARGITNMDAKKMSVAITPRASSRLHAGEPEYGDLLSLGAMGFFRRGQSPLS